MARIGIALPNTANEVARRRSLPPRLTSAIVVAGTITPPMFMTSSPGEPRRGGDRDQRHRALSSMYETTEKTSTVLSFVTFVT